VLRTGTPAGSEIQVESVEPVASKAVVLPMPVFPNVAPVRSLVNSTVGVRSK